MPIDLVFPANPIDARDPELARRFEDAVRGALAQATSLGAATLRVRFTVWEGDELRYVCKVEGVPAARLDAAPPAWRFWSGLFATPEELGEQIADALHARATPPSVTRRVRPVEERWGWTEMRQA